MSVIDDYFNVCEEAARAGGEILRAQLGRVAAREKGPGDLVTEADLASQETIRRRVLDAFPDHQFVGEEDTSSLDSSRGRRSGTSPYRWIVDPLDGTANFVHQMLTFSVSVALEHRGEILVGVVYDPMRDECYSARAGGGAFLNGQRLQVSACGELSKALVAASFSPNVQRGSPEIERFIEVLVACQSMRRLGSAALNLSYVAAGRLDAYYATSVCAWDVAAGILLVNEAGGVVTSFDGQPFRLSEPTLLVASSDDLHAQILQRMENLTEDNRPSGPGALP